MSSKEDDLMLPWRKLGRHDRDEMMHYENEAFRRQYIEKEMPRRLKDSRQWLQRPVRRLLEARRSLTRARPLHLLSLGCGPGSDLLGGIECLAEAKWLTEIKCTGVDLVEWDWTEFLKRVRDISRSKKVQVETNFVEKDMEDYAYECVARGNRFDLITLSYACAKYAADSILEVSCLPTLLRSGGSIVIIDNNYRYSELKELPRSGYKIVYDTSSKIVIEYEKK